MDKTFSDIGQIAITVSDVGNALAFCRDAPGRVFLLRPRWPSCRRAWVAGALPLPAVT